MSGSWVAFSKDAEAERVDELAVSDEEVSSIVLGTRLRRKKRWERTCRFRGEGGVDLATCWEERVVSHDCTSRSVSSFLRPP